MNFGINVTYHTKPGKRQDLLDGLSAAGIRDAVRAEAGCLQYDYYLSVSDPDEVLLVERWESQEAQKLHLTQPHMDRVKQLKERFVERTTLVSYEL